MGIGVASGDNRAVDATRAAISSPLLETSIEGARGVLLNITSSTGLGLFEVNEAAEIITQAADPGANIIFGAGIDESMDSEVRVTVIATGFEQRGPKKEQAAPEPDVKSPFVHRSMNVEVVDIPEFLRRRP